MMAAWMQVAVRDSFFCVSSWLVHLWLIHMWYASFTRTWWLPGCRSQFVTRSFVTHTYAISLIHMHMMAAWMQVVLHSYSSWPVHSWRIYMWRMQEYNIMHMMAVGDSYSSWLVHLWLIYMNYASFMCIWWLPECRLGDSFMCHLLCVMHIIRDSYSSWLIHLWLIYMWDDAFIYDIMHMMAAWMQVVWRI